MIELVIGILLFALIVVCLFMVLLVLLQRGSTQGGMGTAFGGGVAESTFGADTGNVLSRATVFCSVIFFGVSLGLYLLIIGMQGGQTTDETLDLEDGTGVITEPDTADEGPPPGVETAPETQPTEPLSDTPIQPTPSFQDPSQVPDAAAEDLPADDSDSTADDSSDPANPSS